VTERRTAADWAVWIGGMLDDWVNVAEIELSVLQRQCLNRRIPDRDTMHSEIAAWEGDRDHRPSKIDWHFTTSDARIKLKHMYPKL
jgi:hypothetical protein